MKAKQNKVFRVIMITALSLFALIILTLGALYLFVPYSMPIGGAEDTDGDGIVDSFWDGHTERMSNFDRLFKQ